MAAALLVLALCASLVAAADPSTSLVAIDHRLAERDPVVVERIVFGTDASQFRAESQCHVEVDVLWVLELAANGLNTPLVADFRVDGSEEIIVATAQSFVEAVHAEEGQPLLGWPFAFEHVWLYGTPLLFDVDGDGSDELLVTLASGELLFLSAAAAPLPHRGLVPPPMDAPRDWFLDGHDFVSRYAGPRRFDKPPPPPAARAPRFNAPAAAAADGDAPPEMFNGFTGTLTPEGVESLELFVQSRPAAASTAPFLSPALRDFFDAHPLAAGDAHVRMQPHALNNPVLADLDGDGSDELLLAVTYYLSGAAAAAVPHALMYGGCALVAFDAAGGAVKWSTELELSRGLDSGRYAHLWSPPAVADLDGDGRLDVALGSGSGLIFALSHAGTLLPGFPVRMAEVVSAVVAEDLDGDGRLELLATDAKANVAAFRSNGALLWDNRLSGYSRDPAIGDIDGDGVLDVVYGTTEGHLFALRGTDGRYLDRFPIKFAGGLLGSPTLLRLRAGDRQLHIVVPSADGHVNIVDPLTGCHETVDVGHRSETPVLIDDVTGNGRMDLIFQSAAGELHLLATDTAYHPLNAWTPHHNGRAQFTTRWHVGVFVSDNHRQLLEMHGSQFVVHFEIVDARRSNGTQRAHYDVAVSVAGRVAHRQRYTAAGAHSVLLEAPRTRTSAIVRVAMHNELGQYYDDWVSVSFNRHFFRTMKWVVALPFAAMAAALLLARQLLPAPLGV